SGHAADLRPLGRARAAADRSGGPGGRPDRDRRRHRRGGEAIGGPAGGSARPGVAHRRRQQRRRHRSARGGACRQGRGRADLRHRHRRHRDAGAGILRPADGQPLGRPRRRHAQGDHRRNRRALLPCHRQQRAGRRLPHHQRAGADAAAGAGVAAAPRTVPLAAAGCAGVAAAGDRAHPAACAGAGGMSELLQQFHFLHPWWLLALLGLPLLALPCWRRDSGQLILSRLVDPALLPRLLRGQPRRRQLPLWLFALAWLLATLALYANRPAQVLAISLSRHMLARDVAPSRLDRARLKAHELLAANRAGLNALIGYAGEAFVVAPLTSDAHSLDDLLDAMAPDTVPVDGNDAAAAIDRGVRLVQQANADGGTLVLITDQADTAADAAARKALAAGVRVSVLGVGSVHGGPVPLPEGGFLHDAQDRMVLAARDDAALDALARAGGGVYVAMSADHGDIDALHAQLRSSGAAQASGQHG